MIRLTRLNNTSLAVNCDLIKFVENAPDTVITLSTGEKVVVRETLEEIIDRIVEFRRRVLADAPFRAAGPMVVPASSDPAPRPVIVPPAGEDSNG